MQEDDDAVLYMCMGSACHRLGVYDILPRLQDLMQQAGMTDKIPLRGHFCLNNCSEAAVIKFGDRMFERILLDNIDWVFEQEILPCLQAKVGQTK